MGYNLPSGEISSFVYGMVKKPELPAETPAPSQNCRPKGAAYGANEISHSMANTHLIICAIQNAIGAWVDPPATPDRVLKALGKA
jgi:hypothetical protein